jgi:Cu+-exporting ATPase
MTKDPVCGMMVDEKSAAGHVQYYGKDYYFCSEGCQHKFEASPEDYIEPVPATSAPHALPESDNLYTCPIHPMVLAPRPGTCPICGTTLEPLAPRK